MFANYSLKDLQKKICSEMGIPFEQFQAFTPSEEFKFLESYRKKKRKQNKSK
jgi:hypothetical protein